MNNQKAGKNIVILAIIAIVAIVAYSVLTMPDNRTTGERIGDAVDEVSEGGSLGDAARQLEDRTPGEKLGDAVENAGENIQRNTDR